MPNFQRIGKVRDPLFSSRLHRHDHEQICMYLTGSGTAWIGPWQVSFQPGTVIRYPPVLPHRERSPDGTTMYYFSNDDSTPLAGEPRTYAEAPDGQVRRTLDLMYDLQLAGRTEPLQRLYEVVELLLTIRPEDATAPAEDRLRRAIETGYRDPGFSLERVMAGLGLSPNHLRRRFIASTGLTPVRFLGQLRVEQAKLLLRRGGMTVRMVAAEVGLPDPYYFSRVFTSSTGISPSRWASAAP